MQKNICCDCREIEYIDLDDFEIDVPTVTGSVALTPGAILPQKGSPGAAGFDLCASENVTLRPGRTTFVSTGVFLELPKGIRAMVYPRSGLSTKQDIIIPNSPGLIDSDYRGEVKVALHMLWSPRKMFKKYKIKKGDRIAQLVFGQALDWRPTLKLLEDLQQTSRGSGGFGSTGK